jgi:DHA1 family multidrug resistance protein-like MFS transporter
MGMLCAAGLAAYFSYALCRTPLLPLLARQLGASPELTGLVMAASTLTGVFVKLPAGAWSDLLGRVPLLLIASALFALMPLSYLAATSVTVLIAIRFVHGSATAIMGPVMSATISDMAPADRRATWLSLYATAQGVGQALAPLLAGILISRGDLRLIFLIAAASAMVVPALIYRAVGARPRPPVPLATTVHLIAGVSEVLRERRILVASTTHAAYFVINGTLNAFLPLFAIDRLGLSAAEIGALFGVQTLTTLAIRPLIGAASDRWGRRSAIAAGLAGCGVGVLGISIASSTAALYTAVLIYASCAAVATAATHAYITDVAPKSRFGAAHGVFGTIYDIGDAGGPLVAGVMIATLGYAVTFQAMAALALVSAVGFLAWSRR